MNRDDNKRYLVRDKDGIVLVDFFTTEGQIAVISIANGIEVLLVSALMKVGSKKHSELVFVEGDLEANYEQK